MVFNTFAGLIKTIVRISCSRDVSACRLRQNRIRHEQVGILLIWTLDGKYEKGFKIEIALSTSLFLAEIHIAKYSK